MVKYMVKNAELKKQDIVDEMVWDNKVDASNIKIKVDDGEVTLSGTVGSFREKTDAEWDVWPIPGVRNVVNNLTVDLTEGFTYPSDEELKKRVEDMIRWDHSLNSSKIDFSVTGGIVTLEGTVDSFWKISYAADTVSMVSGIIGITNKLAVAPKEKVSDEIVAKEIMDAIDRKLLVKPSDVKVRIVDGRVTLEGEVSSWSAWREAYKSAENTFGVIDIEDQIVISS